MAYFQRSSLADRDVEQAITSLKKGAYLLKYGRRGKPKFFPFRLSNDETALLWYCGKSEKQIKLSSVSRIIPGQRTAVFQRYPQPEKEYQSFSLIYGGRSLDLICKDKDEAETWITALRSLIPRGSSPQLRSDARSDSISSDSTQSLSRPNSAPNVSSCCNDLIDKDEGESCSISVPYENSPRSRQGKVFSEVLSQAAARKAYTQLETNLKSRDCSSEDFENMPTCSSVVYSTQARLSSAASSSSQGSCFEDFNSLCDIYIWGEGVANRLLGGRPSSASSSDAASPKILESNVALDAHNVACGSKHAVLVTKQGQIFSWGEESGGRLGHGVAADFHQPTLIDAFGGLAVEFAACGEFHTCAVTLSGDLYVWGDGTHNVGLLGLGSEASHWRPIRLLGQLEGIYVSNISCGPWHTAFATTAGQLFTFGDGTFGALGHGDRSSLNIPREVETLRGLRATRTSCGVWHTAAVVETTSETSLIGSSRSGKLFTWGDGSKGQLGHGDKEPRLVPSCVSVSGTTNFQQVACGENITIALTVSGQVFCMGIVDQSLGTIYKSPTSVEGKFGHSQVEEVACGSHHIAVLNKKAEVYTWGKGKNGQLGHGDNENRKAPTLVKALKYKRVKRVVCGSNFTVAICCHKPISSDDHYTCAGCQNPFNFRRKPHNCYNCGKVFCKTCTSKRSIKAAMAPNMNKSFRVCDDCFDKLERVTESPSREVDEKSPSNPKALRRLLRLTSLDTSRPSLDSKLSSDMDMKAENSLCSTARLSLNNNEVVVNDVQNLRSARPLSRLTSFDSLKPERKESKSNGNSATSHVARHSVAGYVPGLLQLSVGTSLCMKSSPGYSVARSLTLSDFPDPEFTFDGSKKTNQCLTQEIALLKAQVEDLTQKSHSLETELEITSRKLEEATRKAEEDAEKNKSSKALIESLTMQLMDAAVRESDKPNQCRKSV